MTFNLNSAFKWTGISYTDYDGDQFAKIKGFKAYLVYGYSRFWLIFIIYDFVRFSILALYPRNTIAHELMGFYLFDWAALIKGIKIVYERK